MRCISLILIGLLGSSCTKPPTTTAVTIPQTVEVLPSPPVVDPVTALVDDARADIDASKLVEASAKLFAIACPGRELHGPADFAKCPPPATGAVAVAWSLIGRLAQHYQLVIKGSGWIEARLVVNRWSRRNYQDARRDVDGDAQLAIAETAYAQASLSSTPDTESFVYTLGMVRFQRKKYEAALQTFLKVLDTSSAFKHQALDGAADCIAKSDWDVPGNDDDPRYFARPEVQRALARDAAYMAELYAYVVEKVTLNKSCDDAQATLAAMRQRFSGHDATKNVANIVQASCP